MDATDSVVVSLNQNDQAMGADDGSILPDGISFYKSEIGGKSYRVAVVADTDQQAQERIASLEPFTDSGLVAAKRLKALARQGIHLEQEEVPPPPLAFVFPGQGSHYAGMSHELYQTFQLCANGWIEPRKWRTSISCTVVS